MTAIGELLSAVGLVVLGLVAAALVTSAVAPFFTNKH